jgi:hypothetical protein
VDHNFFASLRLGESKKRKNYSSQSREGAKNWELFLGAHPPQRIGFSFVLIFFNSGTKTAAIESRDT